MEPAITAFFTTPLFAVVGASAAPQKFGHKLLAWYLSHSLPVTPINPTTPSILNTPCLTSIKDLPDPKNTALSIVTPPAVTAKVLEEAVQLGVKRVWLQPGTWEGGGDREARELIGTWKGKGLEVVVAGDEEGLGGEGACVLLHGTWGMGMAGRKDGGKL